MTADPDPRVLDAYARHRLALQRYADARLKVQGGDAAARRDMIRAAGELAQIQMELHALREQGILR